MIDDIHLNDAEGQYDVGHARGLRTQTDVGISAAAGTSHGAVIILHLAG